MTATLLDYIRELVRKGGPLTVAAYMEIALLHPDFGYYRHAQPLGRRGDFITAPEISQMFGEMIGLWCVDVWRQMGAPSPFVFAEFGPGRGALMQDALRASAKIPDFQKALRLHLVESSVTLRHLQARRLEGRELAFHEDVAALCNAAADMPMLVVANEFFDAMPIRQFEKSFQGWCERRVGVAQDGNLTLTLSPPDHAIALMISPERREALPGAVHEVSVPALSALRDLSRHIVRCGGAALVVDYGYVEPDGRPTLQAVSRHQYADIFEGVGETDLTALVDFSALRRVAEGVGAQVSGPLGQGEFLRALGIELRAAQLKRHATDAQAQDIDSALARLTDPGQMGALFKAMAVAAPSLPPLPGF